MPGYRTHMVGGIFAYIGMLFVLAGYFIFKPTFFKALEWFFCSLLGSLFPDIDTKSQGQILFYQVVTLFLLLLVFQRQFPAFVLVALLAMVPLLVHHRGLFHKVWFVSCVPIATVFLLTRSYYPAYQTVLLFDACFFSAGALSHILFDRIGSRIKRRH